MREVAKLEKKTNERRRIMTSNFRTVYLSKFFRFQALLTVIEAHSSVDSFENAGTKLSFLVHMDEKRASGVATELLPVWWRTSEMTHWRQHKPLLFQQIMVDYGMYAYASKMDFKHEKEVDCCKTISELFTVSCEALIILILENYYDYWDYLADRM